MKNTIKKEFDEAGGKFSVDLRAIGGAHTVLQTLEFDSKKEFSEFLQTQCIRPDAYLDLSEKDLRGMDFSGIDGNLIIADFRWSNLTGAKFNNSNLIGADFTNATLQRTDFTGAETATALAHGSDMRNADITPEQIDLMFGKPMILPSGRPTDEKAAKKMDQIRPRLK